MVSDNNLKNKKNTITFIALLFLMSNYSFSQIEINNQIGLTGSLYPDSKIIMESYSELSTNPMADDLPSKKSPVLSGVLSAIIPGAGQIYNEDYWIAAAFVVVEAALVTTAIVYDNKGDEQTVNFENFADENWSAVKYAEYLNGLNDPGDPDIEIDYDTPGLQPWERIVDWNQLNEFETGSHHLPQHGEQQYYEQIGKYKQYIPGWPGGNDNVNIPQIMLDYSSMRGQANDYYNYSSTAVVGIYVNHLLAAAEAVWGANRFNDKLAINLRVEPYNFASGTELVPTLKFKFSF